MVRDKLYDFLGEEDVDVESEVVSFSHSTRNSNSQVFSLCGRRPWRLARSPKFDFW